MGATRHQKHEAGRLLAVAHALLRGYSAKTLGTSTHVEINGLRAVVMLAGMGARQIADIEKFTASDEPRYILVDVTDGPARLYIVPGDQLRAGIRTRHDEFLARVGGERPRNPVSKHTAIEPAHVAQWEDCWSVFSTDRV